MQRLTGKKALITGAAQGIGRATALRFAEEGAEVIATDINEDQLEALASVAGITVRHLDVCNETAIRSLAAELGGLDVLFNCAGYVHNGTLLDCDEAAWDFSMDLNVKAMYRMLHAFLPATLERCADTGQQASIINMSSVAGALKGPQNRFAYSVSKGAVMGLTRSIAADYVSQGIRCNAICPGTVESPSLRDRFANTGDPEKARRDFTARQPMGRLGQPEEIAALAAYLASDEAAFTTGQMHVIDGGWCT